MAARTYRMPFRGDPYEKLQRLVNGAARMGVTFNGSTESGSFSGMGLSGYYHREGQVFIVTIESVPLLMSYDGVAARIQSFLNE
jgi:hypothetical protein